MCQDSHSGSVSRLQAVMMRGRRLMVLISSCVPCILVAGPSLHSIAWPLVRTHSVPVVRPLCGVAMLGFAGYGTYVAVSCVETVAQALWPIARAAVCLGRCIVHALRPAADCVPLVSLGWGVRFAGRLVMICAGDRHYGPGRFVWAVLACRLGRVLQLQPVLCYSPVAP